MVDTTFYLVTQEIAQRSGVIASRYRTQDGRFILDNKDLSYIRFTPDEYIDGLAGVEKITKDEAMKLIKANGYRMGVETPVAPTVVNTEVEKTEDTADVVPAVNEQEPTNEEPTEETASESEDMGESTDNNEGEDEEKNPAAEDNAEPVEESEQKQEQEQDKDNDNNNEETIEEE